MICKTCGCNFVKTLPDQEECYVCELISYPGTENNTYEDIIEVMHIRNLVYYYLNLSRDNPGMPGKPAGTHDASCTSRRVDNSRGRPI